MVAEGIGVHKYGRIGWLIFKSVLKLGRGFTSLKRSQNWLSLHEITCLMNEARWKQEISGFYDIAGILWVEKTSKGFRSGIIKKVLLAFFGSMKGCALVKGSGFAGLMNASWTFLILSRSRVTIIHEEPLDFNIFLRASTLLRPFWNSEPSGTQSPHYKRPSQTERQKKNRQIVLRQKSYRTVNWYTLWTTNNIVVENIPQI